MKIPQEDIPLLNVMQAKLKRVEKELLFVVGGGLGDQVCAEPTLRYALKNFKDATVSAACENPELFRHLKLKDIIHFSSVEPDKYLKLYTFPADKKLSNQFMSSILMNTVNYCSVSSMRRELPPAARIIQMDPPSTSNKDWKNIAQSGEAILIHPGRSWKSKTFPAEFWEKTVKSVQRAGKIPVIIGKNVSDSVGYVDFDLHGAIDLRDKLDILDFMWICKTAHYLITNDSSPIHIASSSHRTKIAFIATCKHPDLLLHWRPRGFAWGMKNFSLGGMWNIYDGAPYVLNEPLSEIDPEVLKTWLPEPDEMLQWLLKSPEL